MPSTHRTRRLVLRANRVGSERGTKAMRSAKASAQAVVQSGLRCRRSSPGPGCRRAQRRAGCTRSGRSRASRRSRGCPVRRTRCRRLGQGADNTLASDTHRQQRADRARGTTYTRRAGGTRGGTAPASFHRCATPRASQSHGPPGGPARACCAQRGPSRRRLSCPGTGCQRRSRC